MCNDKQPGLTLVRFARNSCDDFCKLSSRYDQPHTHRTKHIVREWALHEIQTAENCQTEKHDRNEIITVAKIILTNQMVLIVDCDFSSIVFVLYTQQKWFRLNFLKFSHTIVFSCQIDDFVWFSQMCGQTLITLLSFLAKLIWYLLNGSHWLHEQITTNIAA